MVAVYRFKGEVAEEVVVDVKGLCRLGYGVDAVEEHVRIGDVFLAFFGVLEQVGQRGFKAGHGGGITLCQGFLGAGAHGSVLSLGNVGIELFSGIQIKLKIRLDGAELSGETVHTHNAARRGAGDGADFLAAFLEDGWEAVVHALGQLGMLSHAAGGKAAVHAVVFLKDIGRFPQQRVSGGGEGYAIGLGLGQDVPHRFIGVVAGPVAAGTVAAVVADVEGVVPSGSRGIVYFYKLVGMGVKGGPLGKFLQELDHLGALLLGIGGGEGQRQGKEE